MQMAALRLRESISQKRPSYAAITLSKSQWLKTMNVTPPSLQVWVVFQGSCPSQGGFAYSSFFDAVGHAVSILVLICPSRGGERRKSLQRTFTVCGHETTMCHFESHGPAEMLELGDIISPWPGKERRTRYW